jgi:hypothetical protein
MVTDVAKMIINLLIQIFFHVILSERDLVILTFEKTLIDQKS